MHWLIVRFSAWLCLKSIWAIHFAYRLNNHDVTQITVTSQARATGAIHTDPHPTTPEAKP